MNVSVAEVLAGAVAHAVPLTAECVGYLVLGAADQVLGAPRCLGAGDLVLSEDGAVRVAGGRAASAEDAERDLRALLDALLLRASGASTGLLRASRRPAGNGIQGLVRELETALIPVNRAAAKRALSRLQRETRRALDSGRIRLEESVPPAAVAPSRAPVVELPAPTRVAPSPAPVVEESASAPLPSVALPPVLPPTPSELMPSELTPSEPVPVLWAGERRDHTLVLAEVAPRPPVVPEQPQLAETRPEPVVQRASQRPTAPPAAEAAPPGVVDPGHTVPLPPVSVPEPPAAASPPCDTPVLGTRIVTEPDVPSVEALSAEAPSVEALSAEAPSAEPVSVEAPNAEPLSADTVSAEPPTAEAPSAEVEVPVLVATSEDAGPVPQPVLADAGTSEDDDFEIVVVEEPPAAEMRADDGDGDGLIEVIFEDDQRTVYPEDHELLLAASDEREPGETTDPCPPLAAESMLPPPCEVVTAAPLPLVAPLAEALSELPPVAPKGEALPKELDPSEVELAALVESALPPWTREEAPLFEVTPPPRVALPEPRRSDVQELLVRLGQTPLGVDELRSGLKRLAGLDLTPPPPGTAVGE